MDLISLYGIKDTNIFHAGKYLFDKYETVVNNNNNKKKRRRNKQIGTIIGVIILMAVLFILSKYKLMRKGFDIIRRIKDYKQRL